MGCVGSQRFANLALKFGVREYVVVFVFPRMKYLSSSSGSPSVSSSSPAAVKVAVYAGPRMQIGLGPKCDLAVDWRPSSMFRLWLPLRMWCPSQSRRPNRSNGFARGPAAAVWMPSGAFFIDVKRYAMLHVVA